MLKGLFRRRVELDRRLVQGKFSTVLYIFLTVLCIPVIIYMMLVCLKCCGLFEPSHLMSNEVTDEPTLPWAVLYHYIDPGNQTLATPGSGRAFALMLTLLGSIFMNGFLVSAIVGWYDRFVDKWNYGLARYNETLKRKQYVVIIGAHESVPCIIRQLLERYADLDYVVVQTNQHVESLRSRLLSYLSAEEEKKVILYAGDRTSKDDIRDLQLNPEHTREVFIVGDSLEDDGYEKNHDALNLNCLHIIAEQLRDSLRPCADTDGTERKKLVCRVMFEYQTSFSIFQYSDISDTIKDIIDFKPMNFYELWAQRVFVNDRLSFDDDGYAGYLPLEGKSPIGKDSEDTVHLVVVGMSRMGTALGIEAARLAHYPNFVGCSRRKTRITFIDRHCHTEMKYFQGRFKELFALCRWRELREDESMERLYEEAGWNNDGLLADGHYLGKDFIDVEWEFISRGIEEGDVHHYLRHVATDAHRRFTIAICLPNDNNSVAASLYLPEEVYEKAVQVLVYQYHNSSVIDSISVRNRMNLYYTRLKAFGMMKEAYDDRMVRTQESVADILDKEYYKMYKRMVEELHIEKIQTDSNRGKSKIAKYWSNVYNANTLWTKLRSIGSDGTSPISEADIRDLAITEHNRWVMEQLLMRFRCLTPDEQKKAVNNLKYKEELKGCRMAHLDICSHDRLHEIDPKAISLDEGFIRIIPKIIRSITQ